MTPLEETQARIKTLTELVELRNRRPYGSWRELIEEELSGLRFKERQQRKGAQKASASV